MWDFISSDEAVDIVQKSLSAGADCEAACQVLIETATKLWHIEDPFYRDDVSTRFPPVFSQLLFALFLISHPFLPPPYPSPTLISIRSHKDYLIYSFSFDTLFSQITATVVRFPLPHQMI